MLELLVVLAIMGLLILAVPQLTAAGRENVRVRAAAYELAAALRGARAEAIARNAEMALVIDMGAHAYRLEPGGSNRVVRPELVLSSQGIPGGAGTLRVRFFPDGSSSGGHLEVNGPDTRSHQIEILPLSGRVTVDD